MCVMNEKTFVWRVDNNYRLSPHFLLSEFLRSKEAGNNGYYYFAEPKVYQKPLFEHIVFLLEQIREHSGVIRISSGYRDRFIMRALMLNPKHRVSVPRVAGGKLHGTDHSYMDGRVYGFGVGAADIIVKDPEDTFKWIVANEKLRNEIGQVIFYKEQKFIHIGNPKKLVFQSAEINNLFPMIRKVLIYKNHRFQHYENGGNI